MGTTEPDEVSTALGKAITIRRVELGLSRNDLRDRSGLSYPYVAELERGLKSPSSKALEAIATALDMRPHELLAWAEQLMEEPATPLMAPPPPSPRRAASAPPPAASAPRPPAPAPKRAGRWFGPAGTASSTEGADPPSPVAGAPATPVPSAARPRLRRASVAPPPELTEDRVREIVREELRRLVTEEPE